MTIVDRSGPGVRITLLDNERAPSGEPLDLAGRIIAFTYEDAEKKADQVSLQLDNFDLALFERAELVGGATLEVSWGYPGNMAPPRRVVVKKLKGFQTLTIEGQATSVLMNREAKTRSWANKSRADVVREIAAEHGYEGEFLDVEDTGEVLDTINQSAETDARFLRRLAAREEYEYFVDDTGFHWRSRDQASAPKHVLTWFSEPRTRLGRRGPADRRVGEAAGAREPARAHPHRRARGLRDQRAPPLRRRPRAHAHLE